MGVGERERIEARQTLGTLWHLKNASRVFFFFGMGYILVSSGCLQDIFHTVFFIPEEGVVGGWGGPKTRGWKILSNLQK